MMVVHFEILTWLNLLTSGWVRRILWADQCFLKLFLKDCRLWRIGSAVAAFQIRQAVVLVWDGSTRRVTMELVAGSRRRKFQWKRVAGR